MLEAAGVPLRRMICVGGGERIDLGHRVFVSVYPSLHSCLWTGSHGAGAGDVCIGDLGLTWQERAEHMKELAAGLATSLDPVAIEHLMAGAGGHSNRGDGGAFLYLFETPEGSVLFQDTSGHWSPILATLRPDVAILAAAGRGNVDGEPVQGSLAAFVATQANTLQVLRVVLAHHDDWLPGFSSAADLAPIRAAFAEGAPGAELLEPEYLAATPIFDA